MIREIFFEDIRDSKLSKCLITGRELQNDRFYQFLNDIFYIYRISTTTTKLCSVAYAYAYAVIYIVITYIIF